MADEKRLKMLKKRTPLFKEISKAIKDQGFNVKEYSPMFVSPEIVSFADIFIPEYNIIIKFFRNTKKGLERQEWFYRRYKCANLIFVDHAEESPDFTLEKLVNVLIRVENQRLEKQKLAENSQTTI